MTDLKERHRVFVDAYMSNGGNGTEAARTAGYSGADAVLASRASELLAREDVKAALTERAEGDPRVADRKERQAWWSRVMHAKDENGKAIKVTMKDRLEASKLLARAQGDFVVKHEVKHGGQVVFYIPDNGRGPPPVDDDG